MEMLKVNRGLSETVWSLQKWWRNYGLSTRSQWELVALGHNVSRIISRQLQMGSPWVQSRLEDPWKLNYLIKPCSFISFLFIICSMFDKSIHQLISMCFVILKTSFFLIIFQPFPFFTLFNLKSLSCTSKTFCCNFLLHSIKLSCSHENAPRFCL